MRHTASPGKALFCTAVSVILVSVFRQPATADESAPARDMTAVGQSSLDDCGRDDPFAPLVAEAATPAAHGESADSPQDVHDREPELPSLHLRGIVWSRKLAIALINDALVLAGDEVAGWRIVSIERDKVILEIAGRRQALRIETPMFGLEPNRELREE